MTQNTSMTEPTYQQMFLADPFAQAATQIGISYGKPAAWIHQAARELVRADDERVQLKGKPMSPDHLLQAAAKLAKEDK